MNQLDEQELELHVTIAGWLNIISDAVLLLLGLCGCLFFGGIGLFAALDSGDAVALGILGTIGFVGLFFFGALALPGMLAGYGMLKRKRWGQILGIIVSALGLFNFPIGTAIGAYTLFVLLQQSASDYFAAEEPE